MFLRKLHFNKVKPNKSKEENNHDLSLREKIDRWIWVILLIAAVIYFKYLLGWMHFEITDLTQERKAFQTQLKEAQNENLRFYELQAEINKSVDNMLQNLGKKRSEFDRGY